MKLAFWCIQRGELQLLVLHPQANICAIDSSNECMTMNRSLSTEHLSFCREQSIYEAFEVFKRHKVLGISNNSIGVVRNKLICCLKSNLLVLTLKSS